MLRVRRSAFRPLTLFRPMARPVANPMRGVADIFSILLHPLFMPVYTLWLVLWVDPQLGFFLHGPQRIFLLGMVAVMTIAFPLTSALLLIRAGMVDDLRMPDRKQRAAPFIMTLLYFGMTYYLLRHSPAYWPVLPLFGGAFLALLFAMLITLYWKISMHMVGIGGLIGALAGVMVIHSLPILPLLALVIILAGVLGSARLLSGDHSPSEVYAGAALGFLCTHTTTITGWMV